MKHIKKLLILLICISAFTTIHAQHYSKYMNKWYSVHKSGMDFSYTNPIVDTSLSFVFTNAHPHTATICDYYGNILLYIDTETNLRNRNNNVLINGDTFEYIDVDYTKNFFLPKPDNPNQFYFVTSENDLNHASYSIIDISTNNNQGSVILKDRVLMNNPAIGMDICKHSNGFCYWVVLHHGNDSAFYAYPMCGGNPDTILPVISKVSFDSVPINNGFGEYKIIAISPNGKKIALGFALPYLDTIGIGIFDFDASTGIVSNPLAFNISDPYTIANFNNLTFSPNSRYLYVIENDKYIHQLDTDAGSQAAILSSDTIIANAFHYHYQYGFINMQIGLDGKLYIGKGDLGASTHLGSSNSQWFKSLAVINNPDSTAAKCDFQAYSVQQYNGSYFKNIPQFPSCYSLPAMEITYDKVCLGDTVQFSLNDYVTSVYWDFGDTTNTNPNPVMSLAPTYHYDSVGTYEVTAYCLHYGWRDTAKVIITIVNPPVVNLGADTTIDTAFTLAVDTNFVEYWWSSGDSTSSITFRADTMSAGNYTYWVQVTDSNGCYARDTINILNNVSFKDYEKNSFVKIYPNPTGGKFYLKSIDQQQLIEKISIHDLKGNLVLERTLNSNETTIDLHGISSGVYLLEGVFENGDFFREKIIKQ